MRSWILHVLFVSIGSASLAQAQAPAGWQAALSGYLARPPATRIEALSAQAKLVETLSALPPEEYEAAIFELGKQWQTHPDEIYPMLDKLQTKWELRCYDPVQIQLHADQAEQLHDAETAIALTLLTSIAKPALLPQMLAAYAMLGRTSAENVRIASCGRAPFSLLMGLAATPKDLTEAVARARDQAIATISAEGVNVATLVWATLAQTAKGTATIAMRVSLVAKQALIIEALSYGAYLAATGITHWQRGNNILEDWQKGNKDLQNALTNASPSINAAARNFYLLTQKAYAFYSYDSLNAQAKLSESDQAAILQLKYLFQNSCSTKVDERYLLSALQNQQSDQAAAILRNGGQELNMTAHRWIQEWHQEDSGKDETVAAKDMLAAERDFLHPNAKLVQFLKKKEIAMKTNWPGCSDGLYFIFTVADWLDAWSNLKPDLFQRFPDLQDAKDRIDRQLLFAYSERESLLSISTPRPINAIATAWSTP